MSTARRPGVDNIVLISGGAGNPAVLAGTVDPSAGVGVAASEGSLYLRYVGGAGEVWQKTGALATDWVVIGGGGVTNPLILQTGNGTVTAPVGQASGAIGHGIDGDVGTADVQVDPLASGLAIGWVDSFAGGTAQVKATGKGSFASGYVSLGGAFTGEINAAQGAHAFGSVSAVGYNASISATGFGALAGGWNSDGTLSATGKGAFARGYVNAQGVIQASSDGASARGYAHYEGQIVASYIGAFASGYVYGADSHITADSRGAHALGGAYEGAHIEAGNAGSFGLGYAREAYSTIEANAAGSFAMGFVTNEGDILTGEYGAMARGYCEGHNSQITADGFGAFASGSAKSDGDMLAFGDGGHCFGECSDGSKLSTAPASHGCLAGGHTSDGAAQIYSQDRGCLAFGRAAWEGDITARGDGSFAFGFANGTATYGQARIYTNADGGFAHGYARDTQPLGAQYSRINCYGKGAFATGYVNDRGTIEASGGGAFAGGYVTSAAIYVGGQVPASIEATALGAFAHGVSKREATAGALAYMKSTSPGAWAGGYAWGYSAALPATIYGSAAGALAHGYVRDSGLQASAIGAHAFGAAKANGSITASGYGALAVGYASGYGITASGIGSGAFGSANAAAVQATAINAFQFGPGTNALADTVQVGAAGIRFKGTTGAPGAPQNGDVWVDGVGNVVIQSGGASVIIA